MLILPERLHNDPGMIEKEGVILKSARVVSRIGILLSIYFLDGHTFAKKKALSSILETYLQLFGGRITAYHRPEERRLTKWAGQEVPEYYKNSLSSDEALPFYFMMKRHDPTENDDPSLWSIRASAKAAGDLMTPLSGLKVHFPPTFVFDDADRFVELIVKWCEALCPVHGSCGLGDLTNQGEEITEVWHYPLLQRYPGLEYDAMGSFFARSSDGGYDQPRSSNWITILGNLNVERLGGEEAILPDLIPDVCLTKFGTGIVLRAGPLPSLGDSRNGGIPNGYRSVGRLLRPIRFENYKFGIFKVPNDLNGRDETLKWLRRFESEAAGA